MVRIIAHRSNLNGPGGPHANQLPGIHEAVDAGFDSEVDLWLHGPQLFLGHDGFQTRIYLSDLDLWKNSLWIHCKNAGALGTMIDLSSGEDKYKFFTHAYDPYALVSSGLIWAFPGSRLAGRVCIAALPELAAYTLEELSTCFGICTDYPSAYQHFLMEYQNARGDSIGRTRKDIQADYLQFLGNIRSSES